MSDEKIKEKKLLDLLQSSYRLVTRHEIVNTKISKFLESQGIDEEELRNGNDMVDNFVDCVDYGTFEPTKELVKEIFKLKEAKP